MGAHDIEHEAAGRRGEIIDHRYKLGDVLGIGGMGVVYAAVQKRLERVVAVKIPRRDLAADPTVREHFRVEALAGSRVAHPTIARVFDFGESWGIPYLVMERVVGTRLGELLGACGPLSVAAAIALVRPILEALVEVHAAGIVHGDLKCDNILIETHADGSRVPRLIDFGLARFTLASRTAAPPLGDRFVSGTPEYLAPELVSGRVATVASDIYAIGVILYELVTGATPFGGGTSAQTMWRQLDDVALPVSARAPGTCVAFDDVVARALAKLPGDRYASAADLLGALGDPELLGTAGDGTVSHECARDAITQPMQLPVGSPPRPAIDRDALGAAFATGDRDLAVVAYLEVARALIETRDDDAAIAELESGVALLASCAASGPVWRLQIVLAGLYDRIGDRARACRVARAAHAHAVRLHSPTGRVRAKDLLSRLVGSTYAPGEPPSPAMRTRT